MVTALRLQDETAGVTASSAPSRRLTVATSHTCGGSVPRDGRVELLIHRHLSQDDGRGLAEGVADSSRQQLQLHLSLQSLDSLPASLPTSNVQFEDAMSLQAHLLRLQHPLHLFLLSRAATPAAPDGFAEFASVSAAPASLLSRVEDWQRAQLTSFSAMARPFPANTISLPCWRATP